MNIKLGSNVTKFILGIAVAVLVIGSALDAVSNAITIITPTVTYILTGLVLVGVPVLILLEGKQQISITYPNGKRFKFAEGRTIAVVIGVLIVIWIPFFSGRKVESNALGVVTQREVLEVPKLGDYEVFYPRPFASVPNLNFNKMVDNLYTPSTYELLEQRKDGFKIRIHSIGEGRMIEWIAVGPIN